MNIKALLLTSLMIITVMGDAAPATRAELTMTFLKGNRLYAEGDYSGARDAYLAVVNSGVSNPAVYYNLGNACYKLNKIGEAVLYYEKAHRLSPRDPDINLNLEIARMATVDDIEPLPRNILFKLAGRFQESTSLNEKINWALAGYLGFFIGLHLLLFDHRAGRRRAWKTIKWLGLAVFIVFSASSASQVIAERNKPAAIIQSDIAKVRAQPIPGGEEIFTIHAGTKVLVEEKRREWLEIRLEDGKYGWVPRDVLETVP